MKKCRKPPQNTFRSRRWSRMIREIKGLLSDPANRQILEEFGANLEIVIHRRDETLMRNDIESKDDRLKLKRCTIRKLTQHHPYLCWIEDIIQQTESGILKRPMCGQATRRELVSKLAAHSLTFADKVYVSAKIV